MKAYARATVEIGDREFYFEGDGIIVSVFKAKEGEGVQGDRTFRDSGISAFNNLSGREIIRCIGGQTMESLLRLSSATGESIERITKLYFEQMRAQLEQAVARAENNKGEQSND